MIKKIKTILSRKSNTKKDPISNKEKLDVIDFYRKKFELNIFVETGTFLGDTIYFFKNSFTKLFSIELSQDLASRAIKRFRNEKHIKIIQGNSADILESLLAECKEPCLFWLDGHYSSEFFYNDEYFVTAKADKNTPVEKEIDILLQSDFYHLILIDDARLFIGENDYPTIEKIEKKIQQSNKTYSVHVDKDIIHIIPQ